MPNIVKQTIDVSALQNRALNDRLRDICLKSFYIHPEEYDLDKYPSATIELLRDLSLTKDPKDPANIVGFNMIAYNVIEIDGKRVLVMKVGPCGVYPFEYRGDNFVPEHTLKFLMQKYLTEEFDEVAVIIVAGNPRFREIIQRLPDQHSSSPESRVTRDTNFQRAARGVYPESVHTEDFTEGGKIGSNWVPRKKDDHSLPKPSEKIGEGTAHFIRFTFANMAYAATKTIFRKSMSPFFHACSDWVLGAKSPVATNQVKPELSFMQWLLKTEDMVNNVSIYARRNSCVSGEARPSPRL